MDDVEATALGFSWVSFSVWGETAFHGGCQQLIRDWAFWAREVMPLYCFGGGEGFWTCHRLAL